MRRQKVRCSCGKHVVIPAGYQGAGRCPACGSPVDIPGKKSLSHWFVMVRDKVQGPFSEERIQGYFDQERLGQDCLLSTDRTDWVSPRTLDWLQSPVVGVSHAVDLSEVSISRELLDHVGRPIADIYQILPLEFDGTTLTLAIAEIDEWLGSHLEPLLGHPIRQRLADKAALTSAIEKFYPAERSLLSFLPDDHGSRPPVPEHPDARLEYIEHPGSANEGQCSDPACPCLETPISRDTCWLYIPPEWVDYREGPMFEVLREDDATIPAGPTLVCEQAATLRGIDLEVAAADARYWWESGMVPVRSSP